MATRLPENFSVSTFPVFRPYRYFNGRNKSGILTLVLKLTENLTKTPKYTETYRNVLRLTENLTILPHHQIYREFRYIFDIFVITESNGIILGMR